MSRPHRKEHTFEVWQGGIVVASGSGADLEAVRREAWHYAMVYAQDGPTLLRFDGVPAPDPGGTE